VLLILLRICQGTALGGEYGGAAIYVAEHAPNDKRGAATAGSSHRPRSGCWRAADHLRNAQLARRGSIRRMGLAHPFPLSVILLAISVWMRVKLAESPHFAKLAGGGRSVEDAAARSVCPRRASSRCASPSSASCARRVRSGIHLLLHAGVPGKVARAWPAHKDLLLIIMTVASAPLYVFFGWLSDRVGRKPVMLAACCSPSRSISPARI
jgi:hypothetical protein